MKKNLPSVIIVFLLIIQVFCVNASEDDSILENVYVETVTFIDDQQRPLNDPTLLHIITLRPGLEMDTERLLVDISALSARFPKYSEVTAKVDPGTNENTVKIIFEFQRKRLITLVRIELGDELEDLMDLKEKLGAKKGLLLKGSVIDSDKEILLRAYQIAGYKNVEIQVHIKEVEESTNVLVTYSIIPNGLKAYLRTIKFTGNKSIKKSVLKKRIKSKTSGFFGKKVLNIIGLEEDLEKLRKHYVGNGFIDVKIDYSLSIEKKSYSSVTFNIAEGRQALVKTIEILGNKVFKREKLLSVFGITENSPYSAQAFRIGLQKLREHYGRNGHPLVKTITDYDSKNEVLKIFIAEGTKQYINEIKVVGNGYMKEELILQDVSFIPGEMVNTDSIKKALKKLRATGYFDSVTIDYAPVGSNNGIIYITVTEAKARFIEFGLGYTSGGFGGDIGYRDPNFMGSGSAVNFSATKTEELTKLSLIYHDPHLFGTDYQMTTSLHFDNTQLTHFERRRAGVKLMIKKMLTKNLKLGIGTRIEFMNISNASKLLSKEIYDASGNSTIIGLISTIAYKAEEYDNMGEIVSGHRFKLALFPSYTDQGMYIKTFGEVMGHLDLGANNYGSHRTISGRINIGYTSENTPFYEKFYAGGMGTVRGFASRSLAPKGSVVGGNYLASANATYAFPLWGDILKGVVFIEGASVANSIDDLSDVRLVGGFGVRANLRNTFLRNNIEAGMALPLNSRDGDILKPFYFMLGNYDPAYDL